MKDNQNRTKVTVLVVEDEALIRLDAVEMIEGAGHHVLASRSADDAMQQAHCAPDILFTDVEMPGQLDGVELAHALRQNWPDLGIIVTSGRAAVPADALPPGAMFLPKPYTSAELLDLVAQLCLSAAKSSPRD